MSAVRRFAASSRSSARACSVRASPIASSAARAALSASASAVSPDARRSEASRRVASACSISDISARRFSAKAAGAPSSEARSDCASVSRSPSAALWPAALVLRLSHSVRSAAIAERRLARNSASRASACASPRASASTARLAATSPRNSASWPSSSATGGSTSIACVASCLAASVSSRLAARRTFASASADMPRGHAVGLALGGGMRVARAVCLRLRLAPRVARFAFGGDRGRKLGLRGLDRAALRIGVAARVAQLGIEIGEAVLRREAARRRGRRIRSGGKAVPAPQVAVGRDEPLAGLELCGKRRAHRAIDHADLRKPARHLGRRSDVARERLGAFGQRGIASIRRGAGPADRRGRIDRRFEIVAERGAERCLVALLDGEQVDRRRPELLGLDVDQLGERFRLRLEPVHAPLGLGERAARHIEPLPRRRMRGLGCAAPAPRRHRPRSAPSRPRSPAQCTSGAPFSGFSRPASSFSTSPIWPSSRIRRLE